MAGDRRVKYTHTVLKQSLLRLLREKPIEKISVKEICADADINRSTFYVYYGSPSELFNVIIADLRGEMENELDDFSNIKSCIKQICAVTYKYRDLMCLLLKYNHIDILFDIFGIWKNDFLRGMADIYPDEKQRESRYIFITSGTCSIIYSWLLGNTEGTESEIADIIYGCIMDSLVIK